MRKSCLKETCALGRWPDEEGIVRWAGVRWYGVPMPHRILWAVVGAWLAIKLRIGSRLFPGCGCIKSVKDLQSKGVKLGKRILRLVGPKREAS